MYNYVWKLQNKSSAGRRDVAVRSSSALRRRTQQLLRGRGRRCSTGIVQRKKRLVTAPPDKCFWVHHGPVLKDLRELRDALGIMSDDHFAYHVTKERNDFARWVREVLHDRALAAELMHCRKRTTAAKAVANRLKVYSG